MELLSDAGRIPALAVEAGEYLSVVRTRPEPLREAGITWRDPLPDRLEIREKAKRPEHAAAQALLR